MKSGKCQKKLEKYQERNYAVKKGKIQKGDLRKYCDRSKFGETTEASSCDCIQQSRKGQKEVAIETFGKVVLLKEDIIYIGEENGARQKKTFESHQEGRQGIHEANQGCEGSNKRRCETQETNSSKTQGKKMKKQAMKEKKHEAKETKAYEKKEDKKENKSKKK